MGTLPPNHLRNISNIAQQIRKLAEAGNIFLSKHAQQRHQERAISKDEATYVLETGDHVSDRDRWEARHNSWSYCVEGRTIDDRLLRIIVAIEPDGLLVVTLIELDA